MIIETLRSLKESNIVMQWIVKDLISPGGWTFFVGETKVGKSIMMVQLCVALQEGKPFLGMETTRHNCLYVQADAGLVEWKMQVTQLAGDSIAWTAHQMERGWLDVPQERQRLRDIIWGTYPDESPLAPVLNHIPFTFVIFDCLHAMTNEDINTKTSMSTTIAHINEMVVRRVNDTVEQVHYVLIHHPNANIKRGPIAGAGSKAFSDACSTKLTLSSTILALEGCKLLGKREIELARDMTTGAWIVPETRMSNFDYMKALGIRK